MSASLIGPRIKVLREERKLSQDDLARLFGFKDEVLARLLALNATRAADERAAGLVAADEGDDEEIEDGDGA